MLIPNANIDKSSYIKDWDLWGPLLICVLLSIIIGYGKNENTGLLFVTVFFVIWIGGVIVTLNAQFLGSKVTIFQSICLLGYCVFPFIIFGLVIKLTPFFHNIVHIILSILGLIWASFCKFKYNLIYEFSFFSIHVTNGRA